MKTQTKKVRVRQGFTVVELVITIAVIGVLTAILVPTFIGLNNKAQVAQTQSFLRNVNTKLAMVDGDADPETPELNTMHDAVMVADDMGFNLAKITPIDGHEIVYDENAKRFAFMKGDEVVYSDGGLKNNGEKYKIWKFAGSAQEATDLSIAGYSIYAKNGWDLSQVGRIKVGFDVGDNATAASAVIDYSNPTGKHEVLIRTNGGALTVNAPTDTVHHFGDADSVNIVAVASKSYHENGTVPFIQISQGRIEIEEGGDVNGIHVANTQTYNEETGVYEKTQNEFTHDVVLDLNGSETKLSRDSAGTSLEAPVLVCQVESEDEESDDEYIWLYGNGTIEDGKVYVTTSNEVPDTSTASDVTTENASDAAKAIANNATVDEEGQVIAVVDSGVTEEEAKVSSSLKGSGTEDDPFKVYDFDTMQKVSGFYDIGYRYFEVDLAKTADGKIDCTGWTPVYLHGSFDGKGVQFTNVTACLFQIVGYQNQNESITLKDFDATMNVSANGEYGAAALIKNIFNSGKTTFDNVNVHGYLEGFWNMGSFYNYGTANYNNVGSDYEVEFLNCASDATLVCASGNTIGGLFGHAYEGAGHSFTMRVNNSEYTGQMYLTTNSGKGNKYFGMTSDYYNVNNHFYFNGVEDTFNNGNAKNAGAYTNSVKIANVVATKESNGYAIAKQSNVSKIVATITAQLTAYDGSDEMIANLSGITMVLSAKEFTDLSVDSIIVLDRFNSVNIETNADNFDSFVSGGVLNIKIANSSNYKTGNIRLQINQYDSTGSIVSAGTLDIAVRANLASQWTIN